MDIVLWKHRIKQCGNRVETCSFFMELKKLYALIVLFVETSDSHGRQSIVDLHWFSFSFTPFNFRVLRLDYNKNTRINFIIIIIIIIIPL